MRQKRTFVTLLLVIAILCLGIAYAAITSVNLTITGSASAVAKTGVIDVQFTGYELDDSSKGTVTASVGVTPEGEDEADMTKATINVSELTTEGDTAIVRYTIENKAEDIAAILGTPSVVYDNTDWFSVKCELSANTLAKNNESDTDTQTATVTVTLLKTPVSDEDAEAAQDDITITINAAPVENAN